MTSKTIPIRFILLFVIASLLVVGCSSIQGAALTAPKSEEFSYPSPTQTPDQKISTATKTIIPTATRTPTQNPPEITHTQAPSATPTWIFNKPGWVNVPILLYHHIENNDSDSRYQVSIADFRSQMKALHEMGYQSIPISLFLDALLTGANLPEKAVVITFDDGHQSVYDNAFPIMSEFGFSGVAYIVANRIYDIPDFLNIQSLEEMIASGWEIGSHSYTHSDLTKNHQNVAREIAYSRIDLEKALNIEIQTFAYPFGLMDSFLATKVSDYGYRAGMGLGTRKAHSNGTLFYLDRIEIYGDTSLNDFQQIFLGE